MRNQNEDRSKNKKPTRKDTTRKIMIAKKDIGFTSTNKCLTRMSPNIASGIFLFGWKRLDDRLDLAIDLNTEAFVEVDAMVEL